jgi:hypothetical protein
VLKVLKVYKVKLERLVLKEQLVLKEFKEQLELKEFKEQLVLKVLKEFKEQLVKGVVLYIDLIQVQPLQVIQVLVNLDSII